MDEGDLLEAACDKAAEYPTGRTYLAADIPPSVREGHFHRLWADKDLLFNGHHPLLVFMEKVRKDRSKCLDAIASFPLLTMWQRLEQKVFITTMV